MSTPTFRGPPAGPEQGSGGDNGLGSGQATVSSGEIPDDKMEQVRELLYGDYQRRYDSEISKLEARISTLETSIERRLDALQARIEALSGELTGERRTSFDELARGLTDLGTRMQEVSKK